MDLVDCRMFFVACSAHLGPSYGTTGEEFLTKLSCTMAHWEYRCSNRTLRLPIFFLDMDFTVEGPVGIVEI